MSELCDLSVPWFELQRSSYPLERSHLCLLQTHLPLSNTSALVIRGMSSVGHSACRGGLKCVLYYQIQIGKKKGGHKRHL